jgi:hypothetical protein
LAGTKTVSTMPTITRTVAKGIAPRVRSPARPKKKPSASKHSAPKNNKRQKSQSNDDTDSSEDSDPKPKKGPKKAAKRQRIDISDAESGIEIVDQAEPEPVVEEVEDNPDLPDDEVSAIPTDRYVGLTL